MLFSEKMRSRNSGPLAILAAVTGFGLLSWLKKRREKVCWTLGGIFAVTVILLSCTSLDPTTRAIMSSARARPPRNLAVSCISDTGTDRFTIDTPAASAASTSSIRIRHQAMVVSGRSASTIARIAAISSRPITGVPASLTPGGTAQAVAEGRDARGRAVAGLTGFTFASSDQGVAVVGASDSTTDDPAPTFHAERSESLMLIE